MIKVFNLSKEYTSLNRNSHLALDDVSFTLPSRGMVFILGKSGSGKSTLLNILGGLDYQSKGNIIVDGNNFAEFDDNDFDNYRNTYLGFIFQDFHLIDNMTVKQNIQLALDLQGKKIKNGVKEVLKQVDLEGYENRYPYELSGGQQQRVAIARAIIKKPRLILADEPTGNLDSKTSKQVLDVLKNLAKNTLVVIVSHNKDDANNYADRIIELADGKIINDLERKSKYQYELINDNVINFPHNVRLTNEEMVRINEEVKKGGYEISQKNDMFTTSKRFYEKDKYVKLKPRHISLDKSLFVSHKFAKGQYFNSIFTSILISCIIILITICQTISTFNASTLVQDAIVFNNDTNFTLQKGELEGVIYPEINEENVIRVEDSEIQEFYDKGYEGNVYKLYNKTLPFAPALSESGQDVLVNETYEKLEDLYPSFGRGVLDCDLDFLTKKYGVNGALDVIAGSISEDFRPNDLIITDYLADAILYYNPTYLLSGSIEKAYQYIVDRQHINNRFSVRAIINTSYKERYKECIDVILLKDNFENIHNYEEKLQELKNKEIFYQFINEMKTYFTIGYYVGENDIYDALFARANYSNVHTKLYNNQIIYNDNVVYEDAKWWMIATDTPEGEIYMDVSAYNLLFGTNLTNDDINNFEPREITIKVYDKNDLGNENAVGEKTLKITNLGTTSKNPYFHLSYNDMKELSRAYILPYGLYFDNVESISKIFNNSTSNGNTFYSTNEYFRLIYEITDVVIIFNDLFILIAIALSVVTFSLMVNFIKKSVDNKKYDIGILRAIGGKNRHLYWIFLYQVILIIGLIFVISTGSLNLLDGFINSILIGNLQSFLSTSLINDLVIIKFDLQTSLIINGVLLALLLITSFMSLFRLRDIKPINIIKSKEI